MSNLAFAKPRSEALDPFLPEIARLVNHHASEDGVIETAMPGLSLIRATQPTACIPTVYDPCLCVVIQGSKKAVLGDDEFVYHAGHFLVVSLTLAAASHILEASEEHPYLCLRLTIDPDEVASLMTTPAMPESQSTDSRGLFVAPMSTAFADALLRLVRSLDTPEDIAVMGPLMRREIYYRVLSGPMGDRLRCLVESGGNARRIASAVEWIKQHFDQTLHIADLAQHVHMSVSSLHHRFKQLTAMTPLQFQKQLRLHEARRLMLGEGLAAADAGHRVGYNSPSQFSRDFSRLFGAPPRRSLATLGVSTPD
ncbi:MAG: AraC family transcriptional regulator [Lysobacteraceae bacterium]